MKGLAELFPEEQKSFWQNALKGDDATQIRIRAGRLLLLYCTKEEFFLDKNGFRTKDRKSAKSFSVSELKRLLLHLCKYSVYAYEDELRQGYLTLQGGHRIGAAGKPVLESGQVVTMRDIAYLNLRIAHEIKGAADKVLPYIYAQGSVRNALIISPPGCGKTTLLRDMIRQISDGNRFAEGKTVGVVDERSELAGTCMGEAQHDLGVRTDVMDGCPKAIGMKLLIRSMAPDVIAVDELGKKEDIEAVYEARRCGVSVLATIHGNSVKTVKRKLPEDLFDSFLMLEIRENKPVLTEVVQEEAGCTESFWL